MKLFLSVILFSLCVSAMEAADPYDVKLGPPTHELPVRIFRHGLSGRDSFIQEQLHAAEVIYAQCGIVVRIQPVETNQLPAGTEQEDTVFFKGQQSFIVPAFLNFLSSFAMDRSRGPLDLHMTEFMDAEIRQTKKVTGSIHYGQAFNQSSLGIIFMDPREDEPVPSFGNIMGNALVVAIETVALHRDNITRWPDKTTSTPRDISLLAHEMGHLLLEKYDPVKKFYGDHYCPALNDWCPRGYLMSGGGNSDEVYRDKKNRIIGYDPLVKMDAVQCERLKNSELLRAL